MNNDRQYLKNCPIPELIQLVEPYLQGAYGTTARSDGTIFSTQEWQEVFLSAAREEMLALDDVVRLGEPVFSDKIEKITPEARQALEHEATKDILAAFGKDILAIEPFDYDTVNSYLRDLRYRFKLEHGLSGQQVMFSMRAALTGDLIGPCLVIIIILLGKERCLQRIQNAL